MDSFDLEVEQRRKLGLPAEVLAAAGWRPGFRVQVQVKRDGRVVVIPMSELLEKYTGAIPGLTAALKQGEGAAE